MAHAEGAARRSNARFNPSSRLHRRSVKRSMTHVVYVEYAMRVSAIVAGLAALAISTGAMAHPGARLLTLDSKSEQAAMGPGVSFEEINGVHLFKGPAQKASAFDDSALLGGEPAAVSQDVVVIIKQRPWRRIRHLRTQGFYSGVPYPSRRYTQGFYSGRR